jgi:tripartite ATP-independent transporter DctP family solute receptor
MKRLVQVMMASAILLAAGSAMADKVVLRMGTNDHFSDPPKIGGQIAFQWLQKTVAERTNGEVEIKIYPGAQLGAEKDTVKMLKSGGIDITPDSPGNLAALVPEIGLFSASYLFASFEHYEKVVSDERFFSRLKKIVQDRNLGYQLVGIGATGSRSVYNRVRPVGTPADLKGMKMRVMASPTEFKIWSTLGMLPTTIASTEIYSALQSGVVDASESSVPYIVGNKYYEVAPYITLTNHQISGHMYLIGDKALAKVPAKHRAALLKTLYETGPQHIRATARMSEQKLEELRAKPGVKVNTVNPSAFIAQLRPIQDEVAKGLGVEDLLKIIREHQ